MRVCGAAANNSIAPLSPSAFVRCGRATKPNPLAGSTCRTRAEALARYLHLESCSALLRQSARVSAVANVTQAR